MAQAIELNKGNEFEDQLKIGQPELKEFIVSSGQNLLDSKNHWFLDKYHGDISYGVETNGRLRDCFGICIYPHGIVMIAYYDKYGYETKPWIKCSSNGTS